MTLPLAQYLQLLVQFQVLEKINQNTFRVKKGHHAPGTLRRKTEQGRSIL